MINTNIIIRNAYQEYLNELKLNNNTLQSEYLNDQEIQNLEQPEYNLTKFEVYKYIKSIDYLRSKGIKWITLTEGITSNENKYNNVLTDLYYQNIPKEALFKLFISSLFNFEMNRVNKSFKFPVQISRHRHKEWSSILINANYIKTNYGSYFGNYSTYETFKELLKIYLDEIWLYYYKGSVYNEKELSNVYDKTTDYYNSYASNWYILSHEDPNLVKLKYRFLYIMEPEIIEITSLGDLKIVFTITKESEQNPKFKILDKKENILWSKRLNLSDFWLS